MLKHTAGQWIDSQYVYETVTLDYSTNSFFCGFVFIPTDCGFFLVINIYTEHGRRCYCQVGWIDR